jgi:hypothetical protein
MERATNNNGAVFSAAERGGNDQDFEGLPASIQHHRRRHPAMFERTRANLATKLTFATSEVRHSTKFGSANSVSV